MPPTDKGSLALAMLDFQSKAPKLRETATNPHFRSKYVPLDELVAATLPVLNECGIVVSQACSIVDGQPALTTRLIHAATGEAEEETMPLFLPKNEMQGLGAALTYGRRYQLASMLSLVSDPDDDGNLVSPKSTQRQQPRATNGGGELVSKADAEEIARLINLLNAEDAERVKKSMRFEYQTSDPTRLPKAAIERSNYLGRLRKLAESAEGDGA